MAARPASPTHAFDPTPALEHDPANYSPLTHPQTQNMGSSVDVRGVRFSDPPSASVPNQTRQSISILDVPLLAQIPSASQLPRQPFSFMNQTPGIDFTQYMKSCQLLRESHELERKSWNIEKGAFQAQIAHLEQQLKRRREPNRRSSNDSSSTSVHSFRSSLKSAAVNGVPRGRISSEPAVSAKPIWEGPEITPPVTRVFSHDDDVKHLPSISEDDAMSTSSKDVSPTSTAQENVSVPIAQLDRTLDGINLRSGALTSSFKKDITSPQFASPARSPSPRSKRDAPLKFEVSHLLSPMDEKLKRYAGHTPMLFDGPLSSDGTSAVLTPKQEQPFAPAPTTRPSIRPSERSDSYFSFTSAGEDDRKENHQDESEAVHETQDDPALKGPLMLDSNAKSAGSATFLDELNAKLKEEKEHQERAESKLSGDNDEKKSSNERPAASSGNDDDMPRLRMKNSMNFGSRLGSALPNRMN